ncbi:MAG TPA: VOC family protein [Anaerolineales bacterium]|nr:VOC family protein [Anaerolineales bacterium]
MPLPPDLSLGHVHLTVSDLGRSLAFYQNALGVKVHRREGETVYLGGGQTDLLALTENPGARLYPNRTGLYHFAILVPSRLELAQSLKHIGVTRTPVQGFADHLVSEAIYLADPDGNGIEIYRDRPRSEWVDSHGSFRMGTEPLDIDGVLAELNGHEEQWGGLHPGAVLGHMHLQIRDTVEAQKFYCTVLGFDMMMNMGHALFVSAGGYHHHVGLNTWQSLNAPPPPPGSVGLRYFVIRLPGRKSVDDVLSRVRVENGPVEENDQGWLIRDPSQNAIIITHP